MCHCAAAPQPLIVLLHSSRMKRRKDGLWCYLARSLRHSRKDALSLCSRISGDMSVVHAGRRGILSLQQKQNALNPDVLHMSSCECGNDAEGPGCQLRRLPF